MATGGQHGAGKEPQQPNGDLSTNGGICDRSAHWTLLPNNLELSSRSKPAKKQRNKEKSRSLSSAENISSNQTHGSPRDNTLDGFFKSLMIRPAKPPKQNIKTPVNQQGSVFSFQEASASRGPMDNENMPTSKDAYCKKQVPDTAIITERLSHLKDCISQLNSVLSHLEQSDEPETKEERSRLEDMRNKLSQDERINKALLQQILNDTTPGYEEERGDSARSSFSSKLSDGTKPREVNGQLVHYTDEDKANIQNHLLEKMKASQEKLAALRQQKSVLISMHKTAEDRLAAYQAELASNNVEISQDPAWQCQSPETILYPPEGGAVNGDISWDKDYANSQVQWLQQNSQKPCKNGHKKFQDSARNEPPDLSKLSINLDHIKRRVEMLQQFNEANLEQPDSPVEGVLDEKIGKSIAAVEWQRKKLKNALVELMEKKKANDELMKELSRIKEAANVVEGLEEEEAYVTASVQEAQVMNEDSERTIEHLRETIGQLREALNSCGQQDIPPKQSIQSTGNSTAKRDNIRKEQNEQFPVRRHYEAEGRANEDTDIPGATGAVVAAAAAQPVASPSPDPNSWENDFRVQEKKRKLENAKQKLQLMQDLVQTIKDAKQSGQRIPASYLQALTSLGEAEELDNSNEEDAETVTDNEDSQDEEEEDDEDEEGDDSSSVVEGKILETKASETLNEVGEVRRRSDENTRSEAADRTNVDETENFQVEDIKSERDNLVKIHEAFAKLQHKFSSSPKQNNEEMRSSGEGGNMQKRKSSRTTNTLPPVGSQVPSRQQENMLTRHNVEAQNRNNSSTNVSRPGTASLKKDNFNDLSAKLSKPDLCSASRPTDLLTKYNSVPFGFSFKLKPSLRDEVQNRPSFDSILKQDRSKPQNLPRNRDIRSNSSINSEPLDGSSSAIAPDTTVAATWGGSSTQDNFEDENDPTESLEEQESNGGGEVGNVIDPGAATPAASNFYAGDQRYGTFSIDSSVRRRDDKLKKYFKSTQLNQWNARKNFTPSTGTGQRPQPILESSLRRFPAPEEMHCPIENASQASGGSIATSGVMPMPDKFMQQLQQQLEKLNALCRPILQEPNQPSVPQVTPAQITREVDRNVHLLGQYPAQTSFPGRVSQQPLPDMMQNYAHQLQLQQQLLLSLSQCYHALYMQQLEIQHLQRCLHPSVDGEGNGVSQTGTQPPGNEDFSFRPWFLTPWMNSVMSSVPFPPGQVSPVPASLFLPTAQPSFTFTPNVVPPNTGTAPAAPCALVTGIQPARAVVHPAAQDNRAAAAAETLNNQMPPRTRANNFVDNFRSYSRQNLLSTSNANKGKESGHLSSNGPQVRQVHPLVPNENSWNHRSRVFIPPHSENSASFTHSADRSFVRPVPNPEFQEVMNRSKKPNANRHSSNQPSQDSSTVLPSCSETDQTLRAGSGDIPAAQSHNVVPSDDRNSQCMKCMESVSSSESSSLPSQPLPDAIQSEMSKLLVQHQPKYLEEFLHELGNLQSTSLQRALTAVRELAHSEEDGAPAVFRSSENGGQFPPATSRERLELQNDDPCRRSASPSGGYDFPSFRSSNDSIGQRSSQTQGWPAATIIPLGKYVPKPSTGAVKKRSLKETSTSAACAWPPSSPVSSGTSAADAHVSEDKISSPSSSREDSLYTLIDRIILDVLPFIQSHLSDNCCLSLSSTFASKIIDALKSNFSLKLTPEFLQMIHQTLVHMMSKYSSLRWCQCEADVLKNTASTLFRELSLFKSMSLRAALEENSEHTTAVPKRNPQPDVLPVSSKCFNDKSKQIIPSKENREDTSVADGSCFFTNSPVQELENHVGELYINMPTEDSAVSSQYIGSSQGSVSGAFSLPSNNWQVQPVNAEEDMGYECDPEAEAEPEVEAGTEADLAEADQSPGQQGSTNAVTASNAWHVPQSGPSSLARVSGVAVATANEEVSTESSGGIDGSSSAGTICQASSASATTAEKEISLDDIPTKLTPMSQEELQKQISEEQEKNTLLLEVAEDVSLAGDEDCPKDPTSYL